MSDPKIELKIQQGIRQAEDEIVTQIQNALDTSSYSGLDPSQFRNLVRVASTTESAEVIKNFLRYQVGRDRKWGSGQGSLAETIIADIGDSSGNGHLAAAAKAIAEAASPGDGSHFKAVWIELIRRYLGYGARHLIYLNKGKGDDADSKSQQPSSSSPNSKNKTKVKPLSKKNR